MKNMYKLIFHTTHPSDGTSEFEKISILNNLTRFFISGNNASFSTKYRVKNKDREDFKSYASQSFPARL